MCAKQEIQQLLLCEWVYPLKTYFKKKKFWSLVEFSLFAHTSFISLICPLLWDSTWQHQLVPKPELILAAGFPAAILCAQSKELQKRQNFAMPPFPYYILKIWHSNEATCRPGLAAHYSVEIIWKDKGSQG